VARQFLERGGFLWNSGIFVWTVGAIRRAMSRGNDSLLSAYDSMLAAIAGMPAIGGRQRAQTKRAFEQAPRISIDYAVMEKADKIAVVEAAVTWEDVGSFAAIDAIGAGDGAKNFALLTAGASQLVLQSQRNLVYAEGKRTVALFGVEDLIVVAVDDAVLVCPRHRAADLKVLVEHVRAQGRTDLL
jgi:mannose-1-phosphate guanylyltransferase